MEKNQKKNKCYYCRKPTTALICRSCRKKDDNGTLDKKGPSVLKIYDKV